MNVEDVEELIGKGLGRVISFLQANPSKDYFDGILNACLYNNSYDPQCEGSRADYLWEIIQLTGDTVLFEEKILDGIASCDDYWSRNQLLGLARLFAENGNNRARTVLYNFLNSAEYDSESNLRDCAEQIVLMDGIEGLLYVAGLLGEHLRVNEEDRWEDRHLISMTEEKFGAEKTSIALEESANKDVRVRRYLEAVAENTQRRNNYKKKHLDYTEIRKRIDSLANGDKVSRFRGSFGFWGKEATEEELKWIAQDLLNESNETKLIGYLYIFNRRAFPLDCSRLIELSLSDNQSIALEALRAIKHIQNPSIYDFALSLIQRKLFYPQSLALLIKNYRDNDYQIIEQVISEEFDSDEFHDIAYSVIQIFEENPTENSLNTMLQIYERGWCSLCRQRCVKIMLATKNIPHNIIKECRYDANHDIRNLASQNLPVS